MFIEPESAQSHLSSGGAKYPLRVIKNIALLRSLVKNRGVTQPFNRPSVDGKREKTIQDRYVTVINY
jgi:hypothetical protein